MSIGPRRLFACLGVGGAVCSLLTVGAQQPPPDRPTFRSAVDLVTVEAVVLDRARRPVRGLTAADFEIYDNGALRPIETLAAVDLPPPMAPPSAPWMREVAPDVVVNTVAASNGRIVVIVFDDGSFNQTNTADLWSIQKTRTVARALVDGLGDSDLAAVVLTWINRTAQNFTSDRALLRAAIDKAPLFPSPSPGQPSTDCFCGLCSIDVVRRVSESLAGVSGRPKTLFYLSVGRTFDLGGALCESRRAEALADMLKAAQAANVTIQAIDPGGLRVGQSRELHDYLRTVAENTGGRATLNDNDAERQVPALLLESGSYYLLGFRPGVSRADGRPHDLKVRVTRPGLQVLARTSYVAPGSSPSSRSARTRGADAALDDALGGAVPSADLPLAVTVSPFEDRRKGAALAIVLGVTERDPASGVDISGRADRPPTLDVMARVFGPEGKAFGAARQTLRLSINPTATNTWEFETLSRVAVPAGRYEVRLAVRTSDGKTASVYAYADVPNFAKEPLSLSGLVLSATPAPRTAPRDAFADLMPIVPTARRAFGPGDRVVAFVRAYQHGTRNPKPATIRLRFVDANNMTVLEESRTVAADAFKNGVMDVLLPLPLERLHSGEHLFSVDVAAGDRAVERSMRINMK